jgi:hypothetical protein
MGAIDQPSILTVCVPGTTTDRGVLDLHEILAARERAVAHAASDRHCSFANHSESNPRCDSCDDSACGIETVCDSSDVDRFGGRHEGAEAPSSAADSTVGPAKCQPSFFHADSGKKALELLRMLRFDLLVTGNRLPDMPISQLIRRVRVAWPWQKWAMVGSMISAHDEIAARTLGALAVFDAPPDWDALVSLAAIASGKPSPSGKASPARMEVPSPGSEPQVSEPRIAHLDSGLEINGADVTRTERSGLDTSRVVNVGSMHFVGATDLLPQIVDVHGGSVAVAGRRRSVTARAPGESSGRHGASSRRRSDRSVG